ncbi:MAG: hypothetical protein NXI01_05745 [Gammaproteobacteria bacterium]|nr:hypothetical protein [Gammaproteobacteria bacterium]
MKLNQLMAAVVLMSCTVIASANTGYAKHRIINNTPNEYAVFMRQHFSYPLEGCQGVIAPHATKECDGKIDLGDSKFFIHAIQESSMDARWETNVPLYQIQSQNLLIVWTMFLDEKNDLEIKKEVQAM